MIPNIDSKSFLKVVKSSYFFNVPSIHNDTSPVSSETIRHAQSLISDKPIAARCRVPYFQLSLGSSVKGNNTPAE